MGGKVLNYEAKDILNRGRAEGEAEGIARMQRAAKLLRMGKSISDVAELTELSEETVTELAQTVEGCYTADKNDRRQKDPPGCAFLQK